MCQNWIRLVALDGDQRIYKALWQRLSGLVGIEACGTSHYWAREIAKLAHDVRLIPPVYVKPYVKRGKSDAIDAAAICEAVTRPTMRFVAIKTPEQQAVLALLRVRDLIVRQRTQIVNMLRGVLAEFGIVVRQGAGHAIAFAKRCLERTEDDLPDLARDVVTNLCHQLVALHRRVLWYGRQLNRAAAQDDRVARLQTIPGVGPITAYAIVASVLSDECEPVSGGTVMLSFIPHKDRAIRLEQRFCSA